MLWKVSMIIAAVLLLPLMRYVIQFAIAAIVFIATRPTLAILIIVSICLINHVAKKKH